DEHLAAVQRTVVAAVDRSSDRVAAINRGIEQLEKSDGALRTRFFPVLAGVGGQEALSGVADYSAQDDPVLRGGATSALASWTEAEALPELVALSRKKVTDSDQYDAVIKGLVRIIGEAAIPEEQKVLHLRDAFEMAETADQRKL